MSNKTYAQLKDEARDYQRLCDEAQALGIPTSLDDPRSPKTVQGLRDEINNALDALPDPDASWALRNTTR